MRFVSSLVVVLSLSSLAGCASTGAVRGSDTAVRAEQRRISDAVVYPDVLRRPVVKAQSDVL